MAHMILLISMQWLTYHFADVSMQWLTYHFADVSMQWLTYHSADFHAMAHLSFC